MCLLDHPNIVKALAVCDDAPKCFVVMPLAKKGSLLKVLQDVDDQKKVLDDRRKMLIVLSMARGIAHLHGKGMMHRLASCVCMFIVGILYHIRIYPCAVDTCATVNLWGVGVPSTHSLALLCNFCSQVLTIVN